MNDERLTLADVRAVEYLDWNNDELWPCYLGAGFRLHDGRYCHFALDLRRRPGEMCSCTAHALGAF